MARRKCDGLDLQKTGSARRAFSNSEPASWSRAFFALFAGVATGLAGARAAGVRPWRDVSVRAVAALSFVGLDAGRPFRVHASGDGKALGCVRPDCLPAAEA